MSAYLLDWLGLLVRWFHVIAGIAWIGSSFYFIWLDNSLQTPPAWKKDKGIKGDLWSIHGGGIYEIDKYQLAPETMPEKLHWFKWEAYTTWLTGTALLIVVYYFQASSYLLGGSITHSGIAIGAGVALLAASVLVYEVLLRTPLVRHGLLFGAVFCVYFGGLSYLALELLSPRAGLIHIGAAIGSIMVVNVFLGIMPAQRDLVAAIASGREVNERKVLFAKLRSTHNNYLTLPIVFCMIGNHYPFIYAHQYGWLLIILIGMVSAYLRHFFNLRHKGITKPIILINTLIGMILIAVFAALTKPGMGNVTDSATPTNDVAVMTIISARCNSCHAAVPTQPGFTSPAAGIRFETLDDVKTHGSKILQVAVLTQYMPLANLTQMTDEERQTLGRYLQSLPTQAVAPSVSTAQE